MIFEVEFKHANAEMAQHLNYGFYLKDNIVIFNLHNFFKIEKIYWQPHGVAKLTYGSLSAEYKFRHDHQGRYKSKPQSIVNLYMMMHHDFIKFT